MLLHDLITKAEYSTGKAAYSVSAYSSAGEQPAAMTPVIRCVQIQSVESVVGSDAA
jgi:hypothetical protein